MHKRYFYFFKVVSHCRHAKWIIFTQEVTLLINNIGIYNNCTIRSLMIFRFYIVRRIKNQYGLVWIFNESLYNYKLSLYIIIYNSCMVLSMTSINININFVCTNG